MADITETISIKDIPTKENIMTILSQVLSHSEHIKRVVIDLTRKSISLKESTKLDLKSKLEEQTEVTAEDVLDAIKLHEAKVMQNLPVETLIIECMTYLQFKGYHPRYIITHPNYELSRARTDQVTGEKVYAGMTWLTSDRLNPAVIVVVGNEAPYDKRSFKVGLSIVL